MSKQSFLQTIKSVCAAFVGIQSNKNRKNDFSHGNVKHFIIAGLFAVVLFISGIVLAVSLVIAN